MPDLGRPFYDEDGITIYVGDCRQVLPELTGLRATILCTDPAYKIESGGNTTKRMMGGIFDPRIYDNSGDLFPTVPWGEWFPLAVACLAQDADLYVMANDKNLGACLNEFDRARIGLHNVLAWNKGTYTPNRWYMKSLEFVAYGWQGFGRPINNPSSRQLIDPVEAPPIRGAKYHPTEKPVELFAPWLENSGRRVPGELDVILDPFMGCGPVLRAARQKGMRAIGIELSADYAATAAALLEWDAGRGVCPNPTVIPTEREAAGPVVHKGQTLMDLR